jgi:hypothetical protein
LDRRYSYKFKVRLGSSSRNQDRLGHALFSRSQ